MTHLTHLSDDQLSALLDDALAPAARADADSHLSSCDVCRAKLAELSSLHRDLGSALTHDPGDAYFATFAERVSARIAAGEQANAPAARRSVWGWLLSPRGLTFAGGMAALLLTAGIAWMRFQHDDAGVLRAAAPSAMSSTADDKVVPMPPTDQLSPRAAAPAPAENRLESRDTRPLAARQDAGELRMREVKKQANGESAPVPAPQSLVGSSAEEGAGAPLPAAEPAPVTAQMKQQAMAKEARVPAAKPAEKAATPKSDQPSQWGASKRFYTAPPPSASTPVPSLASQSLAEKDARAEAQASGGSEEKLKDSDATPLAVQCGTVSDTRGTPLKAVQITLLGATTRSSRSAPDGTFCLPKAVAGDTLILMHVGFEPMRVVLDASSSLAFGLEPIGTLGPHDGLVVGGKSEGFMKAPTSFTSPPSALTAPAPDVYAGVPDSVRAAVTEARLRVTSARRDHTAATWETAAAKWDAIAAMTKGAAGYDARFQALSALREAWHAAPTPARADRLRGALAAFIAGTPHTLPERATALRWQAELAAPAEH